MTSRSAKGPANANLHRAVGVIPRSVGGPPSYEVVPSALGESKRPPLHELVASHVLGRQLTLGFAGYTPLPSKLHAKLKYVTDELALLGGVTAGVHVFTANGLYDPDITGTGHQPRGFDQLIPLYDHYVVMKSEVRVQSYSGTGNVRGVTGIALLNVSTAQTDYIDYAEQARATMQYLPSITTSGVQQEPHLHTMKFTASEFMGIPDPLTATKLQGTINANPADQAFFHLYSQAGDGSTAFSTACIASIEYDVVFIEPVPVASS